MRNIDLDEIKNTEGEDIENPVDEIKPKRKKKKPKKQKTFVILSVFFLLACIFTYGGRLIYFYLDNKKTNETEKNYIATTIKNNNRNSDTFKQIGEDYYFYKNADTNYVKYSNLIWRVIKVNEDKTVSLILDAPITLLAYGDNSKSYSESSIYNWLNTDIFKQKLNNVDNYLVKNKTCIDKIDNIKKTTCKNTSSNYLNLLSIKDYINTSSSTSFINNGYNSYLANKNKNNDIWYISSYGKLSTADGTDIYGIKPVITLKHTLEFKGGTGTKDDPYTLNEEQSYFASYVKLGDDLYRVYDENETSLKLVNTSSLQVNGKSQTHIYSSAGSTYNQKFRSTLAYYLNNSYFYKLPYRSLIIDNTYNNGYYVDDYKTVVNPVTTKVGLVSLGDVIFPNDTEEYFTMTNTNNQANYVYIIEKDAKVSEKATRLSSNIVPCITINKTSLTNGSGTTLDPYRAE